MSLPAGMSHLFAPRVSAVSYSAVSDTKTPPCGSVLAVVCQSAFNPNMLAGTMAILSSLAFKSASGGFVNRYRYPLISHGKLVSCIIFLAFCFPKCT